MEAVKIAEVRNPSGQSATPLWYVALLTDISEEQLDAFEALFVLNMSNGESVVYP